MHNGARAEPGQPGAHGGSRPRLRCVRYKGVKGSGKEATRGGRQVEVKVQACAGWSLRKLGHLISIIALLGGVPVDRHGLSTLVSYSLQLSDETPALSFIPVPMRQLLQRSNVYDPLKVQLYRRSSGYKP